mgnify:CR=1 FL=1
MVLTNCRLSSFAVCADPNAAARQQAKQAHKEKVFRYKSDSVKFWNREQKAAKQATFIKGIGESRARSDIAQLVERKRAQGLSSKEKLAQEYAVKQYVDEGGGSRTAGRNQYLSLLKGQAKIEQGIAQLSGRGQGILLEKQKRVRAGLLAQAQDSVGPMPEFGVPVTMPGRDTGAMAMGAISTGLSIASLFAGSDIRMKEDIEQVGVSPDGHKIYEFNYIGKPTRYRGVMAHEVAKIDPMAVGIRDGYLAVNYGKIDVDMEVIS